MYLDRELIDAVAKNSKVCNHFHIPLQSGDNCILSAMNRNYTQDDYLELIDHIRKRIPDCGITTDIIVGFPGEGEKAFQKTVDLINKVKFSRIHVFSFSKRKGTPAADLPGQIDEKEKQKRNKYLQRLRNKHMIEFASNYLNREVEILVEQKGEGLTSNYIRVLYPGGENDIGKLRQIKIKEIQDGFCRAS
jgi:threonylcarbamoyladenosine tRNA methylthiotransferase MtaB